METNFSEIENYPFLSPFLFLEKIKEIEKKKKSLLNHIKKEWRPPKVEKYSSLEYLNTREKVFSKVISKYYKKHYQKIIENDLNNRNSFETLSKNTRLLDSIIHTAFEYALQNFPILKEIIHDELKIEQEKKTQALPLNKKKLELTRKKIQKIESNSEKQEDIHLLNHFKSVEKELMSEIEKLKERINFLDEQLPLYKNTEIKRDFLIDHLVIFARGGYGRAELSFASDKDLGYCLDVKRLSLVESDLCKRLIIQIENLLRLSGIETSQLYLELNEDLSRFKDQKNIHTIPSVLESRVLIGNNNLANELKRSFFRILPYETFVQNQIRYYQGQKIPELNQMNLKEDRGGLRSLQITIWLAAATFGVFPNQTALMLSLLIQKRIISTRQGIKICKALEFLYELRNFSATAKNYHFDDEAIESGLLKKDFQTNVINDSVERLYLLKTKRFKTIDSFDRYRLQMVDQIQYLSKVILNRLMDRTIVRTFSSFQVVVHLGNRQILEINALEGLPQLPITLIFKDPASLIELFEYIGHSDYDLSFELKDEMTNLIRILTPDLIKTHREEIAQNFSKLILTPYAASAFRIMFEICETIENEEQPSTLIGCFIPETNKMRFLLRNLAYHQNPVCIHTINALDRVQKELEKLKEEYSELYLYIKPKHILALKWGLLFHDVGKIDPQVDHEISGTSIAVKALERIGYEDQELFTLVSLLIVHHTSVVELSRTSAYFDQALQSFFEIADRNLINVILLFLCNISDYISVSDGNEHSTQGIRTFFEETYKVFLEMKSSQKKEPSMDFIQTYLDIKKEDLEFDTRIDLLIKRSLHENLKSVLLNPLEKINKNESQILKKKENDLYILWRDLKLGTLDKQSNDQTTEQLIRTIRESISKKTLSALTLNYAPLIDWFFASFPNRFLLGSPPGIVAENLTIFKNLERPAIVNVITNSNGELSGLLIYVHSLKKIHSRIAYTLHQKQLNIESAKINQIKFASGKIAFCYYIKVSKKGDEKVIFPLELETSIRRNIPPALKINPQSFLYNPKFKLQYLEDDKKGYEVREINNQDKSNFPNLKNISKYKDNFTRIGKNFLRIKISAEDAPLIYYKIVIAFEKIGVQIQQAVITTIGHQVIDTFYITAEDNKKLKNSHFEEFLKQALTSPSEI
tara:strand:+ start:210 stop:3668 length:3459 start_codon:yes stop_codon:yes gene_type:complete